MNKKENVYGLAKILFIVIIMLQTVGCVAVYKMQPSSRDWCTKENCTIELYQSGVIVNTGNPSPPSKDKASFTTSITTTDNVLKSIGEPTTKINSSDNTYETWHYNKSRALKGYMIYALILPIPLILPYGHDYYIFKFKNNVLDYLGEKNTHNKPIGFCWVLFWGSCLDN